MRPHGHGSPDEADVLNGIGAIYQSAACHDEALIYYQNARLIAEQIGNLSRQLILEGIAESTLSTLGQPHAARIFFRQALDIFERPGVPAAESAPIRIETMDPAFGLRIS